MKWDYVPSEASVIFRANVAEPVVCRDDKRVGHLLNLSPPCQLLDPFPIKPPVLLGRLRRIGSCSPTGLLSRIRVLHLHIASGTHIRRTHERGAIVATFPT